MRITRHATPRKATTAENRMGQLVRSHRADLVQRLLDRSPEVVPVRYDNGRNWMHLAAEYGNQGVVQLLLRIVPSPQAMIDARDDEGVTPADLAVSHGHLEVLDTLVSAGLDVHAARTVRRPSGWVAGRTLLHTAAQHGQAPVTRRLLALGVAGDPLDSQGNTPLNLACGPVQRYPQTENGGHNPREVVIALLNAGADPERPNQKGQTATSKARDHLMRAPLLAAIEQKALEHELRALAEDLGPILPRARSRL